MRGVGKSGTKKIKKQKRAKIKSAKRAAKRN
jgi:hypothetical protein